MYKLIIITLLFSLSSSNYAACNSAITRTTPDSRYELLNSNVEVKDKQTGLIWQRCSLGQTWNGTICTGNIAGYTWANALQTAKNMGNGWRVPNIKELKSLIEPACYHPSINDVIFSNAQSAYHWSSSSVAGTGNFAWAVYFEDGNISYNPKDYSLSTVRLVRSGQ
jgi:hypothetical protein